jgi:hypothetical protein
MSGLAPIIRDAQLQELFAGRTHRAFMVDEPLLAIRFAVGMSALGKL